MSFGTACRSPRSFGAQFPGRWRSQRACRKSVFLPAESPQRRGGGGVGRSRTTRELSTPELPMDAVLPYRAMAYNNGWANHRLLAACVRLSQADFVAPRTGFFPSLRATLNHIMIIDRFYVDAMEGGTLGPAAWAAPEPCETVIILRTAQSEVGRRLIAVVERLGAADLNRVVDIHRGDRTQRERVDRLLLHLFPHQIHHRGQAHAMVSST